MQYPTCPLHMLMKPCLHCEPPKYVDTKKRTRVRREAAHIRAGDYVYGVYWGTFIGIATEDAKPNGRDEVRIPMRDEDGRVQSIPLVTNKTTEFYVEH